MNLPTPVKGAQSIKTNLDYYCPTSDCPFIVSSNAMYAPTGIKVNPNPAQNMIYVELSEIVRPENNKIELYNIDGRLVYHTIPASHSTQIPGKNLLSDLNLLRIWDGRNWNGSKVMKE